MLKLYNSLTNKKEDFNEKIEVKANIESEQQNKIVQKK